MFQLRRFMVKCLFFLACMALLPAANAFIIKKIQFVGLQRLTQQSALNYLPVRVGQSFSPALSSKMIQALYKTGFFSQINLSKRGNTLIVTVQERSTIGALNITGNSEIKTSQIMPVLKTLSIQDGNTFYAGKLSQFVSSLQQQYRNMGYYSATVTYSAKRGVRNRVLLTIKINEGGVAKVSQITFRGNRLFSNRQLTKTFAMTTSGLLTFLTHSDRYSPAKLSVDLQSLANFYYDHGYLGFRVVNHREIVSADKKHVSIVVTVSEGPVYTIGKIRVIGPASRSPGVHKLISLKTGDVFSRKKVMAISKAVRAYFSDQGYARSQVIVKTQLNKASRQVNFVFVVDNKNRIYVRRINFIGNDHSQDFALRSWVRQMEGARYSQKLIDESKQKIALLPYFQLLSVQVVPVPNKPNEVDLNFNVKSRSAGQFMVQGGYAELQKFFYTISLSQQNFMGTGKAAGISFTQSKYQQIYKINWSNPMLTLSGVSRSIALNFTKTMPTKLGLGNYDMDDMGVMFNYGIPVSVNNTLSLGFGYDYTRIKNFDATKGAPPIGAYMAKYGSKYSQYKLSLGWSYQNLNKLPFPTSGVYTDLDLDMALPFGGKVNASSSKVNAIGYYRLVFDSRFYYPVGTKGFVLNPHMTVGYGGGWGKFDSLPFFMNFYGGGPNTLPGYQSSSLGPRNRNDTDNAYMGGNLETFAGLNFIFPNPISDSMRTALFVAGGNIFDTHHVAGVDYEKVSLGNMRGSVGLLVAWHIPSIATIEFAISKPVNTKPGDDKATFGFTMGSAF